MKIFAILAVLLYLTLSGNVTKTWSVDLTNTQNNGNLYNLGSLVNGDSLQISLIFPSPSPALTPTSFTPTILTSAYADSTYLTGSVTIPSSPSAVELTASIAASDTFYLYLGNMGTVNGVNIVLVTVRKNNADLPYLSIADFLRNNQGHYFYIGTTTNVTFQASTSDTVALQKLAIDGKTDSSEIFPATDISTARTD